MIFRIILKALLLLILFFFSCQTREAKLKVEGDKLINKIEKFKLENDRLPDSLKDIGIEEKLEGPLYYQKVDSIDYILWFGISLGESITYNSQTKKWNDE